MREARQRRRRQRGGEEGKEERKVGRKIARKRGREKKREEGREGGRASESIQFTSWLSCSHCYNCTANPDMTITGQQPPRELFQLLRVKNVNALETTVMINFLT